MKKKTPSKKSLKTTTSNKSGLKVTSTKNKSKPSSQIPSKKRLSTYRSLAYEKKANQIKMSTFFDAPQLGKSRQKEGDIMNEINDTSRNDQQSLDSNSNTTLDNYNTNGIINNNNLTIHKKSNPLTIDFSDDTPDEGGQLNKTDRVNHSNTLNFQISKQEQQCFLNLNSKNTIKNITCVDDSIEKTDKNIVNGNSSKNNTIKKSSKLNGNGINNKNGNKLVKSTSTNSVKKLSTNGNSINRGLKKSKTIRTSASQSKKSVLTSTNNKEKDKKKSKKISKKPSSSTAKASVLKNKNIKSIIKKVKEQTKSTDDEKILRAEMEDSFVMVTNTNFEILNTENNANVNKESKLFNINDINSIGSIGTGTSRKYTTTKTSYNNLDYNTLFNNNIKNYNYNCDNCVQSKNNFRFKNINFNNEDDDDDLLKYDEIEQHINNLQRKIRTGKYNNSNNILTESKRETSRNNKECYTSRNNYNINSLNSLNNNNNNILFSKKQKNLFLTTCFETSPNFYQGNNYLNTEDNLNNNIPLNTLRSLNNYNNNLRSSSIKNRMSTLLSISKEKSLTKLTNKVGTDRIKESTTSITGNTINTINTLNTNTNTNTNNTNNSNKHQYNKSITESDNLYFKQLSNRESQYKKYELLNQLENINSNSNYNGYKNYKTVNKLMFGDNKKNNLYINNNNQDLFDQNFYNKFYEVTNKNKIDSKKLCENLGEDNYQKNFYDINNHRCFTENKINYNFNNLEDAYVKNELKLVKLKLKSEIDSRRKYDKSNFFSNNNDFNKGNKTKSSNFVMPTNSLNNVYSNNFFYKNFGK